LAKKNKNKIKIRWIKIMNTLVQLKELLAAKLSYINQEEISEKTLLREDLGIDSLRLVDVILDIEEHFNKAFDESTLDPGSLLTVGNLVTMIEDSPEN